MLCRESSLHFSPAHSRFRAMSIGERFGIRLETFIVLSFSQQSGSGFASGYVPVG